MPKVSIIIPFNNVESYIDECLKSVLNQTLEDIEVILINDASTDKSRNIAVSYAKNDKRIKILDIKERKGQGFARNRGIEAANGEYIGFVDSDDFIEPDMFELLYNAAKKDNTDITMCQVREYDDMNGNYINSDYYSLAYLSSFGESVFSAQDTKNQILDINVALWNKIYKREYLINLGEKFPEGFIYEDLPFFFGTYLPAQRINIVWKNLYSYRVNRKNSTMQQFNNKILDRLPMVSLTYEKLKQVPYLADLKQKIQGWIINDLFHRYTLLKENFHREYFFLMKKVFESLDIENIEDSYWSKVYHFQGYLLVINNTFEEFSQKVFNEYINIHKVEDRLRSEMINIKELDRRFALLYEDLNKTYKYTENLVGTERDKITEKVENYRSEIVQQKAEILQEADAKDSVIIQQTDEKIANVYDEITKNYKYTENLISELENLQNEKNNNLYNDIKDLSFVVRDNFVELNKEQNYLKEKNEEIIKEFKFSIQKNQEQITEFQNEYKKLINSKFQETMNILKQTDDKVNNCIVNIQKEAALTKEINQKELAALKSEFTSILELQQQKHNEEVISLQNQMLKMQADLREEMKSPLKKFIEKYRNNNAKDISDNSDKKINSSGEGRKN